MTLNKQFFTIIFFLLMSNLFSFFQMGCFAQAPAFPNTGCSGATVLTLDGSLTGATSWSWTGSNGFSSSQQNPFVAVPLSQITDTFTLNACDPATTMIVFAEMFNVPGVYTFTTGPEVTSVWVSMSGAGGHGAAGTGGGVSGGTGGDGAAAVISQQIMVNPNTSYTITVGAAGSGSFCGQNCATNGCSGGASSFDTLLTVAGGSGGTVGGSGTDGSGSLFGCGGVGVDGSCSANANSGIGYGSGGAGAYTSTCGGCGSGGMGTDGFVLVVWNLLPDSLAADVSATDILCNGETGSAMVTVSGGIPPYSYSWVPAGGTNATASGLSAGTYTVTVTDANSCVPDTVIQTITLAQPTAISSSISAVHVSCKDGNNASATVNVSGGITPYNYSWSSGSITAIADSLSAGNYILTVSDSNNCTIVDSVVVTEPDLLIADVVFVTNVSCNGGSNGSAMAMVLGGTVPYGYSWSSGGTATTENNLSAGTYTLTVTDSNSCIATDTVLVSEPLLLTVDIVSSVDVICNGGNNGSATAGANGGVVPYIYSWSSGSTTALANNLSAESYTVTVTDSNSCVSIDSITIQEPLPLGITLSSSPTVCSGSTGTATIAVTGGTSPYTYLWSTGSTIATEDSLSAGTYTITISDSGSCIKTDSITIISVDSVISIAFTTVPTVCTSAMGVLTAIVNGGIAPYTYSWSSGGSAPAEDSLSTGTYTITITDANGCTQNNQTTLVSTNPLTLSVSSTPTACDTSTGTATAIPSNGTQPYLYSWSTTPVQDSATAFGLAAGNYTVTVSDSNGCSQSQPVSIAPLSGPTAALAAAVTTITAGDYIQLIALGGGTYSWTPVTDLSCSDCQNPVATPSQTITYCVTVSDNNSCTDSACIKITVEIPCGKLEIPTAFSPNNDGHNDLFILQEFENCVESFSFVIFDRWGEKIFETENPVTAWDGSYKGKPLNSAVFVYCISATLISGEKTIKKGNISLIR